MVKYQKRIITQDRLVIDDLDLAMRDPSDASRKNLVVLPYNSDNFEIILKETTRNRYIQALYQKGRVTHLNLSSALTKQGTDLHFLLNKLPSSLSNLTQLEFLKFKDQIELVNNNISFQIIGEIKSLTTLIFIDIHLKEIPEWIANLPKLTYFEWTYDIFAPFKFSDSKFSVLTYLSKLKVLKLEGVFLGSIPESIKNLINLEKLYLINNEITEIPKWIVELEKLKVLNLSGNPIKSIPPQLGELNLNTLLITSDQISEIPETIPKLPLIECKFNPKAIKKLPNNLHLLHHIDLGIDKIKLLQLDEVSKKNFEKYQLARKLQE